MLVTNNEKTLLPNCDPPHDHNQPPPLSLDVSTSLSSTFDDFFYILSLFYINCCG